MVFRHFKNLPCFVTLLTGQSLCKNSYCLYILAEWIQIGGKNYDINVVKLTLHEAKARCIRFGGKLFEPKDAKTNKDVFLQAGTLTNFLSIQPAICT